MNNKYIIPERQTETPFQFIVEDPIIACVGTNGGTYDYDIFRGFKKTVDLIFESSKKPGFVEDVMVYPMVFCVRHTIELGLKMSISQLIELYELPMISRRISIDVNDLNKELHQHDIEKLTVYLEKLINIDYRFTDCFTLLRPLLEDYFFDKKGDMFRYAESIEGNSNLESVNISQVGLSHLYKRFSELYRQLETLIQDSYYIHREYEQGTYTLKLSRVQLEKIAEELPSIKTWKNSSFDDVRNNLLDKYCLSSNELSKAIDCIIKNPHLSICIDKEIILKEIQNEELIAYAEYVSWYAFETKAYTGIISFNSLSETDLEKANKREKTRIKKSDMITDDTLNILQTFYIIGHDGIYCEQFERIYSNVLECKYKRIDNLKKLCSRTAFRCILAGLKECGQSTYLKILEENVRL